MGTSLLKICVNFQSQSSCVLNYVTCIYDLVIDWVLYVIKEVNKKVVSVIFLNTGGRCEILYCNPAQFIFCINSLSSSTFQPRG